MKKIILLSVLVFMITSCDDIFISKKISIRGKIDPATSVLDIRSLKVSASNKTFSLSDAKKVLIFYGNKYEIVAIKDDGTFEGSAPAGSATVIAFLTENNQFIGNLFTGGLNVLPLVGLTNDLTLIDLSTLTVENGKIIPLNDPIGKQIILSDNEIAFIKELGFFYESLAKNIDMDDDGEPDIIAGNELRVNTIVDFYAGKWGKNDTLPELRANNDFILNYTIRIEGNIDLITSEDSVELSGPEGNLYNDIFLHFTSFGDIANYYFRRKPQPLQGQIGTFLPPFEDGIYKFSTDKGLKYRFNYSNVNMRNYTVIVVPTLIIDTTKGPEKEELHKIKFSFQLPDGSEINPEKLIKSRIRIQINDIFAKQQYESFEIYETVDLSKFDFYEQKLKTPINMSRVDQLNIGYVDILGNEYNIIWRNDFKTSY